MLRRIYLDNAATTPIDPLVVEAMMPFLTDNFGNASSIHYFGQEARAAVDKARHQVASLLNARPNEIIFTSGGTEANNLAIRGLIEARRQSRDGDGKPGIHIITSNIEHPSVHNTLEQLEAEGISVTYLPVSPDGIVDAKAVESAIRDDTVLITVMAANNEIGTLQPIREIRQIVAALRSEGKKIAVHTDAVQAAGKMVVDVNEIGCDLLTISAHKIYAPKGIGALYVKRGTRLRANNLGGRQERGLRGGTESVPLIVAFGKAAELAKQRLDEDETRIRAMRDLFEQRVLGEIADSHVNGSVANRLANISNIAFSGVEGEGLLIGLDMKGVAVSTGSACSSGSIEPSPVIKALGVSDDIARGSIRFSFGRMNTTEDVNRTIELLPGCIENLRQISPRASKTSAV